MSTKVEVCDGRENALAHYEGMVEALAAIEALDSGEDAEGRAMTTTIPGNAPPGASTSKEPSIEPEWNSPGRIGQGREIENHEHRRHEHRRIDRRKPEGI